eukprot:TRINITY_DN8423_c0_g1_i3.p1 TRINITY_DN8423_c0_g1~~TRINITY_DN8423_c0_g1_i3.p1  ORF type:complete len:485 (+),score=73.08 TRINITY_DN8423_c0_g1_i3:63-1517(+)
MPKPGRPLLHQMLAEQLEELDERERQWKTYRSTSPALRKRLPPQQMAATLPAPGSAREGGAVVSAATSRSAVDLQSPPCTAPARVWDDPHCPLCCTKLDRAPDAHTEDEFRHGVEWYGTPVVAARRPKQDAATSSLDSTGDLHERERRLFERQRILGALERTLSRRARDCEALRREAEERFQAAREMREDAAELQARAAEQEREFTRTRLQQQDTAKRLSKMQELAGRRVKELDDREEAISLREAESAERILSEEHRRRKLLDRASTDAEDMKQNHLKLCEREAAASQQEAEVSEREQRLRAAEMALSRERRDFETARDEELRMIGVAKAELTAAERSGEVYTSMHKNGFEVLSLITELAAAAPVAAQNPACADDAEQSAAVAAAVESGGGPEAEEKPELEGLCLLGLLAQHEQQMVPQTISPGDAVRACGWHKLALCFDAVQDDGDLLGLEALFGVPSVDESELDALMHLFAAAGLASEPAVH